MYRLLISLYEFGQFLRILLWISVPLVIFSMLVTTWLHYRRKRQLPDELLLSLDGMEGAEGLAVLPVLLSTAEINGNGQEPVEAPGAAMGAPPDPDEKENIYKGILWMKEKYEQYRDMADRRYDQLKEELARTEKKYQDLLESGARPAAAPPAEPLSDIEKAAYPDLLEEKNRQIAFLQQQLDQRIKNFHQAEFERQAYIDQLEGQLVAERQKIEELVTKLQASSQQLLSIYEELDRQLKPAATPGDDSRGIPDLGNKQV